MTESATAEIAETAFESFVALQQANLDLLERTSDPAIVGQTGDERNTSIRNFLERAVATGTILARPAERKAAQAAIDYWTTSLILARAQPYAFNAEKAGAEPNLPILAAFDVSKTPILADGDNPYKGLSPFERKDADNYFGRDLAKIELYKRVEQQSVVLLMGPSASGKTSLLNAGLLPELEHSALLKTHRLLPIILPGREPLIAILRALRPDSSHNQIRSDAALVAKSPGKLAEFFKADGKDTIVILDQFGETLSRADVSPPLNVVGNALASCLDKIKLVICIRESQRAQFEKISGIGKYATSIENCFMPPPPTAQELRSIVEGPADRIGLHFGDGVVDDLVKSVLGNPDALPLLQFALFKLWKSRTSNEITQNAYRALGTPRSALTATADAVYAALAPDDRKVARRILLKLIAPSGEKEFLRNRLMREALTVDADDSAVDRVLTAFESENLLRKIEGADRNTDRFEIAHETLIAYWPTLASWISDIRRRHEMEAKLVSTALLWRDSGRDEGLLISGAALEELRNYRADSAEVKELIEASLREQERKNHLAQRKRARDKIFGVMLALAVAAIVALFIYQRHAAERQEAEALSQNTREIETATRTDLSNKLEAIKNAVASGNQANLRASLRQLELPSAAIGRVGIAPSATPALPDAEAQSQPLPVPAVAPIPLPPPPQPEFAANGDCLGMMWLGSKNNWKLSTPDSPEKLKANLAAVVNTSTSIALRADFPTRPEYTMAPIFGFVPDDTPIRIVATTPPHSRSGTDQYWAKVQVPRKICTKVYIQYAGSPEVANALRTVLATDKFQITDAPEKLDRAAGQSEVRYFFKEDEALARALMSRVKDFVKKDVRLVPLLKWTSAKAPKPAVLEVWIDLPTMP